MRVKFENLTKEEKSYYNSKRSVNAYIGKHTISRNKIFISFSDIREVTKNGSIKFVEKKVYKGKPTTNLIIIDNKTKKIDGVKAVLNVVYSISNKKVVTAFYRGTEINVQNLGKKLNFK